MRKIVTMVILASVAGIALLVALFCSLPTPQEPKEAGSAEITHFDYNGHNYIRFSSPTMSGIVHDPDCPCHSHGTLTEWQELQLAIAMTESRFNPEAKGATGDLGLLQITPIYAREATRLAKGTEYSHNDALDPRKSLEMFNVVQGYHNPTRDIAKAIRLHNPGGASIGYEAKVLANLKFIKRMEAAREAVMEYD